MQTILYIWQQEVGRIGMVQQSTFQPTIRDIFLSPALKLIASTVLVQMILTEIRLLFKSTKAHSNLFLIMTLIWVLIWV